MDFSDLVYIDDTGYHYPDYPTIQQWLVTQYQSIYGADVYLEADSMDGQFIALLAKGFYDVAALGAATYNSFSPVTAQGTGLSRNVKINGLTRHVPSFSTVTLTIVGVTGTVITNGIATDTLKQKWLLPTTVTIPDAATIDVTATAEEVGFVTADMNTVTTIFTPTQGWQTVNNAAAATPGEPVETDAQLRIRQGLSTADPSLTVFDGTIGGVFNLTGVTKVKGYENDTDMNDANMLPPHSICVVVVGGADQEIGDEIMVHKTPGTDTFGDTPVDTEDAHGMPLVINFQRAVTAQIQVTVTGGALTGWTTEYEALIQAAVAEYINALAIGSTIQYTQIFIPAYLVGTPAGLTYNITAITIGVDSGMQSAANIELDFDQNPVCDPDTDVTISIS